MLPIRCIVTDDANTAKTLAGRYPGAIIVDPTKPLPARIHQVERIDRVDIVGTPALPAFYVHKITSLLRGNNRTTYGEALWDCMA